MALRKQPVNIGILFKDSVLYSTDPGIRPVLDLARFSISFASNLVRDSQLVELIYEPSLLLQLKNIYRVQEAGTQTLITREHVLFDFFTNQRGDTIAICATYPSADDLKSLEIANLTFDQLSAQARIFIETLGRRFVEVIDIDSITQLRPDLKDFNSVSQLLQLDKTMASLHEEVLQACQVIFKDDYARINSSKASQLHSCTFLFASVMNGSVPCASRFFKNLEGFFKVKIDSGSQDTASIIENLISAQLSTIITSSLSIAKSMIRQIELKVKGSGHDEALYITFYPIKNDYSLAIIAKGDPMTLRFFTEATARTLASMDVLDEKFIGELSCFEPVVQVLQTIPPVFDGSSYLDFDDKTQMNREEENKDQDEEIEIADGSSLPFVKFNKKLLDLQSKINVAISQNQLTDAMKLTKLLCLFSLKIGNKVLAYYYEKKFDALTLTAFG